MTIRVFWAAAIAATFGLLRYDMSGSVVTAAMSGGGFFLFLVTYTHEHDR